MDRSSGPSWLNDARRLYSEIQPGNAQPVAVFDVTDCDEMSDQSKGLLRLLLEPRFRYSPWARVLDAHDREDGIIRSEGLVPGARHAMRRDGKLVWTLSVRSIVRRRHVLMMANGDSWTIHSPFFSTRLSGEIQGDQRLVGEVGPGVSVWRMAIEPGRDTIELLSALAFLHRQWAHY